MLNVSFYVILDLFTTNLLYRGFCIFVLISRPMYSIENIYYICNTHLDVTSIQLDAWDCSSHSIYSRNSSMLVVMKFKSRNLTF